jgi:hypothetical protein
VTEREPDDRAETVVEDVPRWKPEISVLLHRDTDAEHAESEHTSHESLDRAIGERSDERIGHRSMVVVGGLGSRVVSRAMPGLRVGALGVV